MHLDREEVLAATFLQTGGLGATAFMVGPFAVCVFLGDKNDAEARSLPIDLIKEDHKVLAQSSSG